MTAAKTVSNFCYLSQSPDDSTRLAVCTSLAEWFERSPSDSNSSSNSNHAKEITPLLGSKLLNALLTRLSDAAPQVSCAALEALAAILKTASSSLYEPHLERILLKLIGRTSDSSKEVRASATETLRLCVSKQPFDRLLLQLQRLLDYPQDIQ